MAALTSWTVKVQLGRDSHELSLPPTCSLDDLRKAVEDVTGVFNRHQKLIFKGKVLDGSNSTLAELKLKHGAKIMLMSSAGGVQTTGQRAAQQLIAKRSEEAKAKLADGLPGPKKNVKDNHMAAGTMADRAGGWSKTGFIGLRRENLSVVPSEVWGVGSAACTLDLSENSLEALDSRLSSLTSLQRLNLSMNRLTSPPAQALISMSKLTHLDLSRNCIEHLPPELGQCKTLLALAVAGNKLQIIPDEIANLSSLTELDVSDNCVSLLPPSLGQLSALERLDLGKNKIKELPPELSQLHNLAALNVPSNVISTVPEVVLVGCLSLQALDLHDNPITIQQLRQLNGWGEFDARRRAACDKRLGGRVMSGEKGFDEGADNAQWRRWG